MDITIKTLKAMKMVQKSLGVTINTAKETRQKVSNTQQLEQDMLEAFDL